MKKIIGKRDRLYAYIYGWIYQCWSMLIHRYGYHHTRTLYPADEHGVHPTLKCDWCGLSAPKPKTMEEILAAMPKSTPGINSIGRHDDGFTTTA